MHKRIVETITLLRKIDEALSSAPSVNSILNDIGGGWASSPISAEMLRWQCNDIILHLEQSSTVELSDYDDDRFILVCRSLEGVVKHILPNAPGNLPAALTPILNALVYTQTTMASFVGWTPTDKSVLPAALARKLQAVRRDLDNILPDQDELRIKIEEIKSGYAAAEALPTTLTELNHTLAEVRQASSSASEMIGRIQQAERNSDAVTEALQVKAAQSDQLIARASEAYRVTTTIGLAASFDERANSLNKSVYLWVAGLALSLIVLLVVGAIRLTAMKEALSAPSFEWGRVWVQLILSVLSIGAPVWFGWMSTKQIAQRFRLAEDYAFKASVAKAYEGYRREASSLSEEFTQALFASALKRLDEPPLRLLELSTHGSPVHELAESSVVARLLARFVQRGG